MEGGEVEPPAEAPPGGEPARAPVLSAGLITVQKSQFCGVHGIQVSRKVDGAGPRSHLIQNH